MSLGDLILSAQGRASRMPSVIAAVGLLVLAALFEALVEDPLARTLTGLIAYPALFYCGACVLAKRLHDRGRSGWWAALILVSIVAIWPHPVGFLDFVFLVVLVWAFVELAVMPGERGANRYGANPVGLTVA
jgi:uncharacterized membrane protein YhaH (DUF805 family)